MAENDDSSLKWLPCGVHTSHSEAEERRWSSQEFLEQTKRYLELSKSLVAALKKPGSIKLGAYPPFPHTYETQRIFDVKQHFSFLKKRLQRDKYLEQVDFYERALKDFLSLPSCLRDLKGFPLIPSEVPGLVPISELTTPRTGGRRVSDTVQTRNLRIADLVKAGNSHLDICLTLDKEKTFSVPANWRKSGIYTWRQAHKEIKALVDPLISKVATKKLTS